MSAGAIGGCSGGSRPWADVRPASDEAQSARVNAADDSGRDGVGPTRHGGHRSHHGRGHGLVQAIRQVLDQLGMGTAEAPTGGGTPAVTDTTDVPATDAVAAADAAPTGDAATVGDTPAGGTDPATGSAKDVRHALHAFIHTLFQTLSQGGGAAPAPGGPDADGDKDGCTTAACGPRSGYKNPGTDLSSLVQTGATDGTVGGPDLTALNAAFQDLVSALGGDPANPAVTLQSFLQALLDRLGGTSAPAADPATPPVGALVTTTA